ncbi:cuticle protein 16.8-like [Limulus polyphemus]|uniref:Cuticle protein 16.8-like n=1 Tax=Limulus polyphemus TaxID=6850 RepID=A0ABM1BMM2_LIMPO|nr:cuticle protein 16.8-like [Limulus polyphemus]
MKLLLLCTLVAAAQAGILYTPGVFGTGASTQYRHQDNIGNYNFGYDEGHFTGGTFRRESGDAFGNKAGSYGLKDADGRVRIVNYVADSAGYRADISTNEPGVDLGSYNFGYDEGHLAGGTFRKESGDGYGNKAGSYGLREADGRVRTVNYVADATGFHADVKTNEPGVEAKDPADVAINKAEVVAPVVTYAAAPAVTYTSPAAHTLTYAAAPTVYSYKYAAAPAVYGYDYASVPAVLGYSYASGLPALGHYGYNLAGHYYNPGKHYVW